MTRIERLSIRAINILNSENTIVDTNRQVIYKEYNGYISSLGATIMQSGLIPAVMLYENTNASTEVPQGKAKLLDVIKAIISTELSDAQNNNLANGQNFSSFLIDCTQNSNEFYRITNLFMDATVALKLAIRTYELKKYGDVHGN